jgi:hypothetical protein
MAKTFLFSVPGVIVDNPAISEEGMKQIFKVLTRAGRRVVLWTKTSCSGCIAPDFTALADEVWEKTPESVEDIDNTFIVFDGDPVFMSSVREKGAEVVLPEQMGAWFANTDWSDEAKDPVKNFALPATRLQQAQRVRDTLARLNTPQARATLKRYLKNQGELGHIIRLYPMHKLYQVRALALHDVTYAGSVGFIMSYVVDCTVTFSVFYDRPGHVYTPVSVRANIAPEWLEAITPEEFEELVKKDNPTVVLA